MARITLAASFPTFAQNAKIGHQLFVHRESMGRPPFSRFGLEEWLAALSSP